MNLKKGDRVKATWFTSKQKPMEAVGTVTEIKNGLIGVRFFGIEHTHWFQPGNVYPVVEE